MESKNTIKAHKAGTSPYLTKAVADKLIYAHAIISDMREFNVLIEKGEDNYFIAEVIGLPGCRTQAKSLDELMKRVKEAISLYLKSENHPVKIQDTFVGVQKVAVPSS